MVAAGVPRRLLFFTLALGFASGLPLALSAGTLQAWLTVEGVNLTTLGWLTVLGVPYTYKFSAPFNIIPGKEFLQASFKSPLIKSS